MLYFQITCLESSHGDFMCSIDQAHTRRKQRFFMFCIKSPVMRREFWSVDVLFLQIGNTHKAMSLSFRWTSQRVRRNITKTLRFLQTLLRQPYGGHKKVHHIKSNLAYLTSCVEDIFSHSKPNFSQSQYFNFLESLNKNV